MIGQIEGGDVALEGDNDEGSFNPKLAGFVEEFKRTTSYVDLS